ncbi:32718_t:CDS:1, partial [Gigaspora margarita]
MSSKKSKETKTTLTNEQRKAIIKHKEKNPQISQINLVDWVKQTMDFKVHQSTISRLIKNKDEIEENLSTKRQKTVQYPALENILYKWILQYQERIILSNKIIVEKAKTFARLLDIPKGDFKFSSGWLQKFKKRHRLKKITKHGEDAFVDEEAVEIAIPQLRELLKEYDLKDIYNMDETE